MAIHIGACRIKLRLPENDNLKGKRHVVKSVIARVRDRFNVSIAEVDDNDVWQLITLGIGCVSNDSRHANEVLSKVVSYIESISNDSDAEFLDYEIEIIPVL